MGWFDEQIRQRKQQDADNFEDAFFGIAGAVMGKRLGKALEKRDVAESAIDEILKYYRVKSRNAGLPSRIQTLEEQIEYRMRPHGILHREVILERGWYRIAVGAMLGTLREDGRAVALIPGKFSGYYYYDFKTGERVRLNRKTEKLLNPEASCFYQPLPLRKLKVTDLLLYMKDQLSAFDVVLYVGMMALVSLIGLLSPWMTQWLFGTVLGSGNTRILVSFAVFVLSFAVCQALVTLYQNLVINRVRIKQDIAVEAAVMGRMMSLPANFFRTYASGELTQRSAYVQSLCNTMMDTIGKVGLSALFSLVYIGQIFAFAPALVIPALLITLASLTVSLITTFAQMKITKEKMYLGTKESGMSYAMITGIQKIKLAGAEKRMFSRWADLYTKEAQLAYNPPFFLKISNVISTAILLIGNLILYFFAIRSQVSVADYYAFTASYGIVSGSFTALASIAVTIANIKPALDMSKPLLEAEPELSEDREIVTHLQGGLELNNVTFRYEDGGPTVIDDLTLKIHPGEYVAIVGKTGCGKSTLVRLLLGFEKPQKGAIYYDKKDLSRLDLKSVRRKIGVVTQDGKLFMGDIYSNIVISAPQLTLDDAWRAAEIASVADDIRAMPMGMHTIIAEGQGGISGGQKQRLMIARAVASNPRLLIFDEATSALDNITQKKVSDAIDSLKCTRVVIAHRLSTIRHCDRIIVLDQGKIVEDGKYEELIAQNGFFAELVARQRLDVETPE